MQADLKKNQIFYDTRFSTVSVLRVGRAHCRDLRQNTQSNVASVASRWQLVLI